MYNIISHFYIGIIAIAFPLEVISTFFIIKVEIEVVAEVEVVAVAEVEVEGQILSRRETPYVFLYYVFDGVKVSFDVFCHCNH